MNSALIIEDGAELWREQLNMDTAKSIAETLEKHYPGYLWAVNADTGNNIATIQSLRLSGTWGFYLHLDKIDPTQRKVVQSGGELLERYRVRRGQMDEAQLLSLARNVRGDVVKVDKS
ncbi:hypothetical protein [Hahella ganghwensis]|uniref:hypothetical protein n=1 Tax=Hahella ganghwensis TaxID=286420 RepID=UPI000362B149|nr:hypothetical protein [Hahella ganghwensis]